MRRMLGALLALVMGCADEASVGSTRCTIANSCQQLMIDDPLVLTRISTAGLSMLEPTWTMAGEPRITYGFLGMASAANGGLWVFAQESGTLVAKRLDGDGNLLGTQRVAAPTGVGAAPGSVLALTINSHPEGPALVVHWLPDCNESPVLCGQLELLVFADDVSTPAIRIDASPLYNRTESTDEVYRSQRGDALFIPSLSQGLKLIDLQGRVLWQQPLPPELARDQVLLSGLGKVDESSAFDDDGALLINVNWFSSLDTEHATWRGVLLRQPVAGGPSVVLNYTVPSSGDTFTPAQGYQSFFERDTRGRNLVIHRVDDGDLALVRFDASHADGYRILREDYLDLAVDGTAMDPAGTLHVAFTAGGRDSANQRAVLCSFPLSDAPVCSNIAFRPNTLQAPAAGAVYAIGPGGLVRYDR